MTEIGGYFELEFRKGVAYHSKAIALNTGRNALEYILIQKKYTKVYIPYFTCNAVLEPFIKHSIKFEFYSINTFFEPDFNYSKINADEGFLYTNYFGLKDVFVRKLASFCRNLIIDSTQSFFSDAMEGVPTFYSCRKFFGVSDGSYLYFDNKMSNLLPIDHSENRFSHLLKRIDYNAKYGYNDFKLNDESLINQPIMQMSELTKVILASIDYEYVRMVRRKNFLILNSKLKKYNLFEFDFETLKNSAPMVYPFWTKKSNFKEKLLENNIFVATYWPNVLEWCDSTQLEYVMANEVVYLPIDQRYNSVEMHFILSIIK